MPRGALIVFLLLAIASAGFGCRKPDFSGSKRTAAQPRGALWLNQNLAQQDQSATKAKPTTQTPSKPTDTADQAVAPEVAYVRQALVNLGQAKSFHASLQAPSGADAGMTSAEIDYVKSVGIHGFLKNLGVPDTEMYIADDATYYRTGTSTWVNLADSKEGRAAAKVLRETMNPKEQSTIVSKRAQVVSVSNDPSGCKLYILSQYAGGGDLETINVCVKDGWPVSVTTITGDGRMEIKYRGINTWIDMRMPRF